jgi:maltose/maltodextrin transport system permease protein
MAELVAPAPPVAAVERPPVLAWLGKLVVALLFVGMLWVAWSLYIVGEAVLAALILVSAVGFALIFGTRRFYSTRFIYPGIVAIALFVAFPVVYTVVLGFTNYSSLNLLTYERALGVIMQARTVDAATERPFGLVQDGAAYRIFLPEGEGGFLSDPVPLDGNPVTVAASPVDSAPETMAMRDVVPLRKALGLVSVTLPDGATLQQSGLRTFASVTPAWRLQEDGSLVSVADGRVLRPDSSTGHYVDEAGQKITPGWRVNVGLANFQRIFTSEGIREPMLTIFIWTLIFATLSVTLTFGLGVLLAVILQWPHLRGKAFYRLMLILPYAVPAFISILIFKGLFNQNFGEINMLLEALFGARPDWNTNPLMARLMVVLVNLWLGYPYMMLLAMGFLQSVPEDHKQAAALEGASPFRVFFTITLPQIIPPFLPLLIASFAFNFNNLVLILLLTRGAPDMPGTLIPAGQTDILGSFIYRIGFVDSGQQFGLSGAITFIIFVIVAVIAYSNFVVMRRVAGGVR